MSDNIGYGALPEGAQKYKETKIFTTETIPAGFRREHSTKEKVWGKICSVQGAMTLSIFDPTREDILMCAGDAAVMAPQQTHSVALKDGAEFRVEFYSK